MTAPTRDISVEQVARVRYAEQVAIGAAAARAARNAWSDLEIADVRNSWARLIGVRLLRQIEAAQLLVARTAGDYVDRAVAASHRRHRSGRPARRVRAVPERLVGVASDGRPLPTLLYQPAVTTVRAIELGRPPREAAALGGTQLDMIVRTTIADTGRTATGIEIAATPTLGYVRMLNPPSCSRCVVLAGRFYRWNAGFKRHPRCDCIHIPASEDQADDLRTDPQAYFESLTEAEQQRAFTADGAQAIRDGADVAQVVNARRGVFTAGDGRRVTREGTRSRGARRRVRLMPEQIYREAAGNRAEAIRLLRLYGYIV